VKVEINLPMNIHCFLEDVAKFASPYKDEERIKKRIEEYIVHEVSVSVKCHVAETAEGHSLWTAEELIGKYSLEEVDP